MEKEFKDMTFLEKALDTYFGLWKLLGSLLLLGLLVSMPVVVITLLVIWFG